MQHSPRVPGYPRTTAIIMGTAGSSLRQRGASSSSLADKPRLPSSSRPMVPQQQPQPVGATATLAALMEDDDELSSLALDAVDPFLSPPQKPARLTSIAISGGGSGALDSSALASSAIASGHMASTASGGAQVASPSTYERLGRLRAERIEQLRREEDELRRWLADIEVSPAPGAQQQQQQHGATKDRAATPLPPSRVYQSPMPVNAAPQAPQRKPLMISTESPTAADAAERAERAVAKEARRRARPERFKFTSFDITRSRELQDLLWSFSPISGPPSFRLLPGTTLTTVMASVAASTPAATASGAKSFSFGVSSSTESSSAMGTCTSDSGASPRRSLTSLFVPPPGYTGSALSTVALDSPSQQLQASSPVSFTIPAGLGVRSPGVGKSPAGGASGSFDPSPKHSRAASFRLLRPRPLAVHSEDDEDEAARQQHARDLLKKEVQEQQRRLDTLADEEDEERVEDHRGPDRQDHDDEEDEERREPIEDYEESGLDDDEDGEIASEDEEERLTQILRSHGLSDSRRSSTASTVSVASPRGSPSFRLNIQASPRAGRAAKKATTPTSSVASPSSVLFHCSPSSSPSATIPAGRGSFPASSTVPFMTPETSADISARSAAAAAALASAGNGATPRSAAIIASAIIASAFTASPKSPKKAARRTSTTLTPKSSRAMAAKYPPPPNFAPPPPPPPVTPPPSASPRAFLSLPAGAAPHQRSSSRALGAFQVGSISLSPNAKSLPFSFSVGSAEELIVAAPTPVVPPSPPPPPPSDDDEPAPAPRGPPPPIDRTTYARALARRERRERAVKRLAQARSNNQHVEIEVQMLGS